MGGMARNAAAAGRESALNGNEGGSQLDFFPAWAVLFTFWRILKYQQTMVHLPAGGSHVLCFYSISHNWPYFFFEEVYTRIITAI